VGGASNEATFSAEKIKISIHLTPMTTNPEMFLSFWLLIPVSPPWYSLLSNRWRKGKLSMSSCINKCLKNYKGKKKPLTPNQQIKREEVIITDTYTHKQGQRMTMKVKSSSKV
jgi:hypothetical protein